eukprot:COSAG05_NODE_178_length_14897_cov_619.335248_8_plen_211_part_00
MQYPRMMLIIIAVFAAIVAEPARSILPLSCAIHLNCLSTVAVVTALRCATSVWAVVTKAHRLQHHKTGGLTRSSILLTLLMWRQKPPNRCCLLSKRILPLHTARIWLRSASQTRPAQRCKLRCKSMCLTLRYRARQVSSRFGDSWMNIIPDFGPRFTRRPSFSVVSSISSWNIAFQSLRSIKGTRLVGPTRPRPAIQQVFSSCGSGGSEF